MSTQYVNILLFNMCITYCHIVYKSISRISEQPTNGVCVHCYSHAENHNWTFDDYACYGFRIHALKTMYVMFSDFMRQRLFTSRGLQGMS